jgi:F0F1-type ATP synthase assembly protein I
MASVSHGNSTYAPERPQWAEFLKIREIWASLAISMMWLAVLFDAVYGPNFVSTTSGGDSTTIPSAIFVALFAFLASASVAKHGFRQGTGKATS